MTPCEFTPMQNKIKVVLKMGTPRKNSEVHSFIGWCSYILKEYMATLVTCVGTITQIDWYRSIHMELRAIQNFCYYEIDDCCQCNELLPRPQQTVQYLHGQSDYKLGAAIIQDGRPIAYWSKKLTTSQMNYNTTEKNISSPAMHKRVS